jgi:hypothetical protein
MTDEALRKWRNTWSYKILNWWATRTDEEHDRIELWIIAFLGVSTCGLIFIHPLVGLIPVAVYAGWSVGQLLGYAAGTDKGIKIADEARKKINPDWQHDEALGRYLREREDARWN